MSEDVRQVTGCMNVELEGESSLGRAEINLQSLCVKQCVRMTLPCRGM